MLFIFIAGPALSADESTSKPSEKNVIQFQGVGNKNSEVDPKLYASDVSGGQIEEERESTISLSPGMQKFVDGAGNTIKNINDSMRDSINNALQLLHIEAESTKLKATDGGVGLGISIKLDKGKNQDEKVDEVSEEEENRETFYETIAPSDSRRQKVQ